MAEEFQEIKDQFQQMRESLERLATKQAEETKAAEEQTKATKEQTKETKETRGQFAKGSKEELKDRKALLKSMQTQLRRTQMAQGASMADVAAEHLASGGGVGGAAKAAIGLKAAQLKHRFDPLNLVKKMTGGSKLAVSLAGKVMGRSEHSIRSFADLAPGMDLPTPFFGKGKGHGSPVLMGEGKGGRHGGDSVSVLTRMAVTLTEIHKRLANIETIERLSAKLTQDQIDAERDARASEHAKQRPTKLGELKTKAKDMGFDFLKFITELTDKFKFGLLAAFALLGTAAAMLTKQWDNLKLSFSLLKESASDMWNGVKAAFSDAGRWITDKALQISDTFMNMLDGILESVQDITFKLTGGVFGKKAPTTEERQADLKKRADAGEGRATRMLAAQHTEKLAEEGETRTAVTKLAPSFTGKIPDEVKMDASEALKRGEYDAAATGSLSGIPVTGSPEQKAVTSAVTQLVAKSYGELYKDEQGKPLSPRFDTEENRARRLPALVKEATQALSHSLARKATPTAFAPPTVMPQIPMTATSPTEMAPMNMTGANLAQAAEAKASAQVAQSATNVVAPIITNKTVNTNSTTITQPMAGVRSDESQFARARSLSYAPH